MSVDTVHTPSRRALLGAAIGAGLAAFGAALSRPSQVRATEGDTMLVGGDYTATSSTSLTNSTNSENVFEATTTSTGRGVMGTSDSGLGVFGQSTSGNGTVGSSTSGWGVAGLSTSSDGVYGESASGNGLYAKTTAGDKAGVIGWSPNNATGVLGASGGGGLPAAKTNVGVFGYAPNGGDGRGVWGESPSGQGVHGKTSTGYAGYFEGPVFTTKFWELKNVSGATLPVTDRARVYLNVSSGHQSLRIKFSNGIVRIIAKDN